MIGRTAHDVDVRLAFRTHHGLYIPLVNHARNYPSKFREYQTMAFNQEEAIPAFNEETRIAFAAYLEVNQHRYRITDPTYEQYITYLTNALYEPRSRADQAKRAFVKTSFQIDEDGYALQACPTEKHKQARLVIMQSSIFDIIQEEHCRISHAGVHPTWAAVSQGYYGIIRTEIM